MPEVRAGNATVNAAGDETLGAVQEAARAFGQWLPVDADASITVAELCAGRDGGPREARYGPLRARVLSLAAGGLRFGSEAVKDVAGYDVRRAWLGEVAIAHATLRLAARLPWRLDATLRGGDAFALAEALRALPSAPAAIVVLAPDLIVVSDDAPLSQAGRRERDLGMAASAAGAVLERSSPGAWRARCAALPAHRLRLAGRDARRALPALGEDWAYDAGRRLAFVADARVASRVSPRPRGRAPSADLVGRVRQAIAP
jgi:FAD/FMN-containing dehydrogenase